MLFGKVALNKSRAIVYIIMLMVIGFSVQMNRGYAMTSGEIVSNFVIPTFMIFFGFSWEGLNNIMKGVLIVIGSIWFTCISLHYLVGFHNPFIQSMNINAI